ncbi:DUF3048 domain-containing protein [Phytoactinopolyspora halotolerans]|uniref:DUF3048 domain-containing protein n=1 Tax=Phytoactinopolyspora halotolerans TaxID=1981512 RepID=A0A6L9S794_9ACTN|nr:DUF3048 domain-containing protein [Phytoactinopolyspora halotolerans]NEE00621.1 DUF3048 domain-containing protein [Phytoactinopolyspora halotolerans]
MARMRKRRAVAVSLIATVLTAVLIVVLSVRGDEPADGPAVVPASDRAPLTGLVVEDATTLDHPAVAIKVSDVRQAHPQAGVERADIVFVEPIGLSYTRLAAVFHSRLPARVGPVRSVRPADAPLLGPLSPVFGNTMGAGWVVTYADDVADWDNLGTARVSGSGAYVVDRDRPRPDHVFATPEELLELSELTEPPEPYFDYAPAGGRSSAEQAGEPGRLAVIPYGSSWQVTWTYDDGSGRYVREQPWGPHILSGGDQVAAANVLIMEVESRVDKLVEGHGAPVPVLDLVDASGRFTTLSGGSSVTGSWTKSGVNDPFQLRTDTGDELKLSPGNTWVELPVPDAGVMIS